MIAVGVEVNSRSLYLSPFIDHKHRPSLSIKRSYKRGLDTVTVCHSPATNDYTTASEDSDRLLFEFGL